MQAPRLLIPEAVLAPLVLMQQVKNHTGKRLKKLLSKVAHHHYLMPCIHHPVHLKLKRT